ncbi:hypothetical protein BDV38DRAFT_258846 [Aspergillus pseudotamarii]|uniref:Uncharacterized protein n=1 Tax=Aspergillus pseudotamarii TaxID=132259 RepID=A0A5N6SF39_ASPPS|nr:uncharacterized protein BDV38DRAFT_258846 [Aspergillus pseudotamarii]KAE8133272.1 hypothetical protein BDV38DRAFT_258846 [Aspergillus pseudotamarii]
MGQVFPSEIGTMIGQNPPFFWLRKLSSPSLKPMSCMDAMRHFQTQKPKLNERETVWREQLATPWNASLRLEQASTVLLIIMTRIITVARVASTRIGALITRNFIRHQPFGDGLALFLKTFAVLSLPCTTGGPEGPNHPKGHNVMLCQPPWMIFCGVTLKAPTASWRRHSLVHREKTGDNCTILSCLTTVGAGQ